MDECSGVASLFLGKEVAFDLCFSLFFYLTLLKEFVSFLFVRCICFLSAAFYIFLFSFSCLPWTSFFFFLFPYLSAYTTMMTMTNRRQCTIYSRRYPHLTSFLAYLRPFTHPSIHLYIPTYSHDHCRAIVFSSSHRCSTGSHTYPSEVVFFLFVLCFLL